MYITCQECKTVFQLDESLLKPTGSKVRCSQCGNIFIATPTSANQVAPVDPGTAHRPDSAHTPAATPTSPTNSAAPIASEEDSSQSINGIDLAELDALFSQNPAEPAETSIAEAGKVPDASASPSEGMEEMDADLDDVDFEIDFDAILEAEGEPSVEVTTPDTESKTGAGDDDVDLEIEFELDDDDLSSEEAPAAAQSSASLSEDDGLAGDFELDLKEVDLETDSEATILSDFSALDQIEEEDELELDFDDATVFIPDEEVNASAEPPAEKGGLSEFDLSDELELDLEMEDSASLPAIGPEEDSQQGDSKVMGLSEPEEEAGDNLVLSDLDDILNEATLDNGGSDENEAVELELELDSADDGGRDGQVDPDEELEDLAFELDAEYEDKPIAQAEAAARQPSDAIDEEIDLSEIEQMLEGDMSVTPQSAVADVSESMGLENDALPFDDNGLDLSELEAAIDAVDADAVDESNRAVEEDTELSLAGEESPSSDLDDELDLDLDSLTESQTNDDIEELDLNLDLDLDLEMESPDTLAAADAAASPQAGELDLSDLDDLALEVESPKASHKSDIVDAGGIELEFQIEEEQGDAEPQLREQLDTLTPDLAPNLADTEAPLSEEPSLAAASDKTKRPKDSKPKKKKSSSPLLVILIIILLGLICYGVYYAVTEMGVEIPYLSELISPKPKDTAGIAQLSTMEINSKFIENEQSGRLFVITGKIHSAYQQPRDNIRLQGKLFTKGKKLAQSELVYAGNNLNDQELATLPIEEIKSRLAAPGLDAKVGPNQNLGFMVVFSNLPAAEELDEFAVEVVSSTPVK